MAAEEQIEFRVYNSMTHEKEIFKPKVPGKVSMYVCGVTAYDFSHLGHARAAVSFDILFRYCYSFSFIQSQLFFVLFDSLSICDWLFWNECGLFNVS